MGMFCPHLHWFDYFILSKHEEKALIDFAIKSKFVFPVSDWPHGF